MILTPQELRELTKRDRPKAQARVLTKLGIPFKPHPTDPLLLVDREVARAALGAAERPAANDDQDWDVNVVAIRGKRGKTQVA